MARTSIYHFKTAEEKVDKKKMKKCWKKNMFKFNHQIYKVLKQLHPNIPITCGALEVMNNMISKMMLKRVQKSYKHSLRRKKSDLSVEDIDSMKLP
jgi:hypothetical protein